MNSSPSVILFDLDGTLADTAPDMAAALDILTQRHNKPKVPFEKLRTSVSKGSLAMVRCGFGNDLDEADEKQLQSEFLEIYNQNLCVHTTLFPGMGKALDLIEKNNLRWGVVTNKPGWLAEPLLKKLNLHHRAAVIVSGDTLEKRKPHPDQLFYACEKLTIKTTDCVYIGDDERDAQAAIAANMPIIIAAYGYIDAKETPETWGANALIHQSNELHDHLEKLLVKHSHPSKSQRK